MLSPDRAAEVGPDLPEAGRVSQWRCLLPVVGDTYSHFTYKGEMLCVMVCFYLGPRG